MQRRNGGETALNIENLFDLNLFFSHIWWKSGLKMRLERFEIKKFSYQGNGDTNAFFRGEGVYYLSANSQHRFFHKCQILPAPPPGNCPPLFCCGKALKNFPSLYVSAMIVDSLFFFFFLVLPKQKGTDIFQEGGGRTCRLQKKLCLCEFTLKS